MASTARPTCGRRVCLIREDALVTPYKDKARGFRQPQGCHTRVQGFGVGGQVSNSVHLNLKSGKFGPYRTVSASTWVPEQLPAPLDSASFGIGQVSIGERWRCWTVPGTKSDSCQSGLDRAGGTVARGRGMLRGGPGRPAGTVTATGLRAAGTPAVSVPGTLLPRRGWRSGALSRRRRRSVPRRQGRAGRCTRGRGEAPGGSVFSRHHVSILMRHKRQRPAGGGLAGSLAACAGPAGARVLQQNAALFVFLGLTGLGHRNHVWLKAPYGKCRERIFGQTCTLSRRRSCSRAAGLGSV